VKTQPSLIGLDWGTSSLRAFLMRDGGVVEIRSSSHGVQALADAGAAAFDRAFTAIAGDWLRVWPALPVVACGMVGSAQGWREASYVSCPADMRALAAGGVTVASSAGPDILIAPGVLFDPPGGTPDVMRGEETQVAGALLQEPAWSSHSRMVLPGTHSKWVRVEEGRIVDLATYLTGEMFAVLKSHSVLGRLMQTNSADAQAFEQGVQAARERPADLLHHVFAARTLGLTVRLPHASLADYLSGLLIGHELMSALARDGDASSLVLVGEPALCERYAAALRLLGRSPDAVLGNTAPAGLWALARAAEKIA
jgi:2-dehydro-3-deoxygalactonokinase